MRPSTQVMGGHSGWSFHHRSYRGRAQVGITLIYFIQCPVVTDIQAGGVLQVSCSHKHSLALKEVGLIEAAFLCAIRRSHAKGNYPIQCVIGRLVMRLDAESAELLAVPYRVACYSPLSLPTKSATRSLQALTLPRLLKNCVSSSLLPSAFRCR